MTIKINDPLMDRSMSGWIHNTARQNYWRVAKWYDLSDLIQDGYLAFAKCRSRYGHRFGTPPTKEERKWFMALVQTTFCNHIYDLATARSRGSETTEAWLSEGQAQQLADVPATDIATDVEVGSVLTTLTAELSQLVLALINDPSARHRRTRLRTRRTATGAVRVQKGRRFIRETQNEFYCRLIGADPRSVNLTQQIADHFT